MSPLSCGRPPIALLLSLALGTLLAAACPGSGGGPLEEGVELVYRIEGATPAQFETILQVFQRRLDSIEVRQVVIRQEEAGRVVIQVSTVDAAQIKRIRALLETGGRLWCKIVVEQQDPEEIRRIFDLKEKDRYDPEGEYDIGLRQTEEGEPLPKDDPASYMLLLNEGAVSGDLLKRAAVVQDQLDRPAISFWWNAEGARRFGDLTERCKGMQLAIVLDGAVMSTPMIQERIGDRGQISGKFTLEEAGDLAAMLRAGGLPGIPTLLTERILGAEPEPVPRPGETEKE